MNLTRRSISSSVPGAARLVRYLSLLAALALAGVHAGLAQQIRRTTPVAANIGIEVQIAQSLSLVATNDLSFGQIPTSNAGGQVFIRHDEPDAGRFELRGSGSNDIVVNYVAPTQLTNESGAGVIGVNLELYGTTSQGNASSAERLLQNETVSLSGGRYFFFVGGELVIGPVSSNPPGIYVGEFELEVSYLNL
ncbi:MAG: DUF4402 domain-containing protein [Rhodothermales bacterium]